MNSNLQPELVGKEGTLLLDTVRRLSRRNAVRNLLKLINKTHPADIAWVFRHLSPEDRQTVFNVITQTEVVGLFLSELDQSIMLELVDSLTPQFMVGVLKKMAPDDAADLLEALPDEVADEIRERMATDDREEVDELLQYHPESAGGLMSTEFLALDEDLSVGDATKIIQEGSEEFEMVFYLYIVREDGRLTGVLSLRELLMHPPYRLLKNIMNTKVVAVSTDTDQEDVAHLVSRYNFLAVPVVDTTNKLVGIITVDDIIDVIRKETTEDFLQMVGAGRDDEIMLKPTVPYAVSRAPWIFASCVGGTLSMYVINHFQGELQKVLALASFIPIVMGMGGNIANQSTNIIVRGVATGRINLQEVGGVIFKEIRVGLLLGLFYGLFLGGVAYLGFKQPPHLWMVVGLAIVFSMTMAASLGSIVPLTLKKLGIDAAIATGPVVTTTIDVMGVAVFLSIAKLILHI